jgi:hypothetical protein
VVDKNRLDEYRSRNISDPFNEIRYKFTINKNSILQSNPQDEIDIEIAYNAIMGLTNAINFDYIQLGEEYKMCKMLKNAPASLEKIYLANEGFDFDDIDGSYQRLKKNLVNKRRLEFEPIYTLKAKYYYNKLLDS